MKRIFLSLVFAALACCSAFAQGNVRIHAQTVTTCGTQSLTAGIFIPVFQDLTGTLCTKSGGAGGGDASAANQVLQITQETAINTVLGTTATPTWDGSAAAAMMAIQRYQGVKLEAVRALLAAPLAVTGTFFQATQPVSGTVTVVGPTPDGSAASTNPVLMAGTTDGTATGLVAVPKVTAGGVLSVDGSVAVTSVVPGTAATNLGKAEDSAHASGDVGVFGLALANEAQTVLAQDGDYIGHGTDTKGNTFVTGPVASGAADSGNPVKIGGVYNSAVQAFTNGKRVDLQVDQRGGLLIQDGQPLVCTPATSAATLCQVNDTSGYGSVSIQITSAGVATITYEISEDVGTWVPVNGSAPNATAAVSTSTTATQLIFPTSGKAFRARVSAYTSGTVTIQGTLRKDTVSFKTIAITGNPAVIGNSAENSSSSSLSGIPVVFEARTTNKTAISSGNVGRPIITTVGATVNKPFQVPELDWSYVAAAGGISNTTTAVTMVAAAGAGIRNYVTALQISAGALGAASEIAIRDGAGGTVIWRGFISTAGANQSVNLSSPIKSTANTLLEVVTLTATVTGAVYINAQGYQAP